MVFNANKEDLKKIMPLLSMESAATDPSKKSNKSWKLMSDLQTKSSKRSSAYSKDQVRQLIDLFPEISHLKRRAETENLEDLFPDALAELVEILGSTKKVEQELFRRKESKEKETRRAAEREARKTTGVRFAAGTNESRVFECLESEALKRAGIAEQALANATAARDKVHKLYKGLIATTTPVKCNKSGDDESTINSLLYKGLIATTTPVKCNKSGDDESTINSLTLSPDQSDQAETGPRPEQQVQQQQTSQQQQQQPQANAKQNSYPGNLSLDRWKALRKEARVIITRRLLGGWKMSADACKGSQCNKCPLLLKQKRLQCVVCGGCGSGKDGLYGNNKPLSKTTPSAEEALDTVLDILTPVTMDSQDTPSNILGKLTKRIEKNQQQVTEAAKANKSMPKDETVDEHDEFESLLQQQREIQVKKKEAVIVYDVADSSDGDPVSMHEQQQAEVRKRDSLTSPILPPTVATAPSTVISNGSKPSESRQETGEKERKMIRGEIQSRERDTFKSGNVQDENQVIQEEVPSRERDTTLESDRIELDDQEKQEILDEVHSIISKSLSSKKTNAKRSKAGQEILLKTAQGWSLVDASCTKCEMPLLTDPTHTEEMCVFCEVQRRQEETYIHLDQNRCTPSEITDAVYLGDGDYERSIGITDNQVLPTSVTVLRPDHRNVCEERDGNTPNEVGMMTPGGGAYQHAGYERAGKSYDQGSHQIHQRDSSKEPEYTRDGEGHHRENKANSSYQGPMHPSVASPGFDARNMFPIKGRRDTDLPEHDRQLTSVASPDFDDKDMFPFLTDSRAGGRKEPYRTEPEAAVGEETMLPYLENRNRRTEQEFPDQYRTEAEHSMHPFAPRTRQNDASQRPPLMGILPRKAEEVGPQSQLQPNHVDALQYVKRNHPPQQNMRDGTAEVDPILPPTSPRWPSASLDSHNHRSSQSNGTILHEAQHVYEQQAGERIRGNQNSASSISIYDVPFADPQRAGHNGRESLYGETIPAATLPDAKAHFPPYNQSQRVETWIPPPVKIFSTGVEARQDPQGLFVGKAEIRDMPESHNADFQRGSEVGIHNVHEGIELEMTEYTKAGRKLHGRGSSEVGSQYTQLTHEEMKLRVTENIKAGRMNGYSNTHKKVKTNAAVTADPDILPPMDSASSPRKRFHDNLSSKLTSLDDTLGNVAFGSELGQPKSTNFYEQLQHRAQYLAWPSYVKRDAQESGNGDNSAADQKPRQPSSSEAHDRNQKRNPGASGEGQQYQNEFPDNRVCSLETKTSNVTLPSQNIPSKGSTAVMSELTPTKWPLPSVQEIPNEVSQTKHWKAKDHRPPQIPGTKIQRRESSKAKQETASEVSSLDVSGIRDQRSASPKVIQQTASLVSSLGVPGMDDGNGSQKMSITAVSTTELSQSRSKALIDELSTSSKEPFYKSESTTCRESVSSASEYLLSSIRMPQQVTQEARCDPPEKLLRHIMPTSRGVGRDPEEERALEVPASTHSQSILISSVIKPVLPPAPTDQKDVGGNPIIQTERGVGGYAIVIPDGFDFTDESQMRDLFLSAKQQQSQLLQSQQQQSHPQVDLPAVSADITQLDTSSPKLFNVDLKDAANGRDLWWSPISSISPRSKSPSRKSRTISERRISQSKTFGSNSPSSKHVQATLPALQSSETHDSSQSSKHVQPTLPALQSSETHDSNQISTSPKSTKSSLSRRSRASNRGKGSRNGQKSQHDGVGLKHTRKTRKANVDIGPKLERTDLNHASEKVQLKSTSTGKTSEKSTAINVHTVGSTEDNEVPQLASTDESEVLQLSTMSSGEQDSPSPRSKLGSTPHFIKQDPSPRYKSGSTPHFIKQDSMKAKMRTSEAQLPSTSSTLQDSGSQSPSKEQGKLQNVESPPPVDQRRGRTGIDPEVRPNSCLRIQDFSKSTGGYAHSLIESIRAPARAWDTEVSRSGRSDPPECAATRSSTARVAQDPDDEGAAGSNSIRVKSFHIRLQSVDDPREPPSVANCDSTSRQLLDPEESGVSKASPLQPSTHSKRKVSSEAEAEVGSVAETTQLEPRGAGGVPQGWQRVVADESTLSEVDPQIFEHASNRAEHSRALERLSKNAVPEMRAPEDSDSAQQRVRVPEGRQRVEPQAFELSRFFKRTNNRRETHDKLIELTMEDIKPPASQRRCPRPEASAKHRSRRGPKPDHRRYSSSRAPSASIQGSKHFLSDERSNLTPILAPRVQSPYFDGISDLEEPQTELMIVPSASKSQTRRRSWASGVHERRPSLGERHQQPPRLSRKNRAANRSSSGTLSFALDEPKLFKSRVPSVGEEEASQKDSLLASTRLGGLSGVQGFSPTKVRSRDIKHRPSDAKRTQNVASSSSSSWASEPSRRAKETKKFPRRPETRVATSRRVGDTLKFDGNGDNSVASSSSSISSWPSRPKPFFSREVGARPCTGLAAKERTAGRIQRFKTELQTHPNHHSVGSYSSWATNDRSAYSKDIERRGSQSFSLTDDDNLFFVGGPLSSALKNRTTSTDPSSPDSQGTDSTPFEDILNRCKEKMDHLSMPDEDMERASLPGKYMSFGSSSESQVIDLVDNYQYSTDDRTTRSARSGRTTRSSPANYRV